MSRGLASWLISVVTLEYHKWHKMSSQFIIIGRMSKQKNKIIGVAYVEREAHSLLTYVRPTNLETWKRQVL